MKARKLLALALVAVLAAGALFAGGGAESASSGVPTIKWVQIGNGMPANYDEWKAQVDAYLEEKIGCHLEVEVISWGNWDTRSNVIINTNEPWDIMFTDQKNFANNVRLGAYADISGLLASTPGLTDLIPEAYWQATTVDGGIYGVPTYKDSSLTNYWVWDKAITDKYGIPYEDLHTMEEIEPWAEKVTAGENTPTRILAADAPEYVGYDNLGLGLTAIGVKIDDETRTVVPVFEQPEVMEYYRTLHRWYQKGLINSDSGTLPEAPRYMPLKIAQGWPYAAVTTWGPQMGCEAVVSQASETILTNDTVLGSVSAISASSANQEMALKVVELANTDSHFRNLLYYGAEGTNWEYTEDGRVHRNTASWDMAGYCQATFFNITMTDDTDYNQWDEVRALNENATASVCLGVSIDITDFEDELTNCRTIYQRYKQMLNGGSADPDTTIPQMMAEMRRAGFDKIVAGVQAQIDAQF